MGEYHISGGRRLQGSLAIRGSKNAILPILASVVLNGDVSVIHNCPRITDTHVAINILNAIGCKAVINGTSIEVDSRHVNNYAVPEEYVREMRSSIIFLGGLLGRFKQVKISYPGGCDSILELLIYCCFTANT